MSTRIRWLLRTLPALAVVLAACALLPAGAAAASCSTSSLYVIAHQDDSLLFMSPDLLHDVQGGGCVTTVVTTAGDDGGGESYWSGRDTGLLAALAQMAGVADSWTSETVQVDGHSVNRRTLIPDPNLVVNFLRFPDGGFPAGDGTSTYGMQSLKKLWTGQLSSVTTVDGATTYTRQGLISVLLALMDEFHPTRIATQDYAGVFGDADHPDHHATAYFARQAQSLYATPHTFVGYQDYATSDLPANVTGTDLSEKSAAFYTYAPHDPDVCQTPSSCANSGYAAWLQRQYTVSAQAGNHAPVADAGPDDSAGSGATVRLDGSGSSDPDGDVLSFAWKQTAGPAVTLSSTASVQPTFTAPAGPATLTFALTVSDGQVTSSADTVTISVSADPPPNHAPVADAGPDQAVDGKAAVTLDGSGSHDPDGDPLTYAWTQTAGAPVTLSSAAAAKPTFTAPAGPATLTFSLVVSDGKAAGAADTVTITVNGPPGVANVAGGATVTASSQNTATGQLATKAVDGIADGYPGDYTREWATNGGGAGSWLQLVWSAPQTLDHVVLYDRPNTNDQITAATLTFSDNTTVTVPALPNSGSASTVTFPAHATTSLRLTITAVSSSTGAIGLAELEAWTTSASANGVPAADAGPDQTVAGSAAVTLDGSGSHDPDGDSLTYAWTQTSGAPVTLSSAAAAKPTFTAPAGPATLTFSLTVSDGTAAGAADTVTITVSAPPGVANVAPAATVTASSQNTATGQLAAKAVDGIADGYPGDYTREWATNGGGAGSWLQLTWTQAQTLDHVVLYDRPNSDDQITAATLTFSDGATVTVPTLPNDGSPRTVSFPAHATTSLRLTVTAVSATTGSVGLAELEAWTTSASANGVPVADAGPDQAVDGSATVTLDGSGSHDPDGDPLTYAWTQTSGPTVALSSAAAAKPTFTAPAGPATLTFSLTASDGTAAGAADTVTITVNGPPGVANVAGGATVTASSQNTATGQLATKAVDGIADGYPGDYTREWATAGGGAGSWLQLTWSAPQTLDHVVLYDRPNTNDQITAATLTFSDGATVTVPALPNDGSASTVTFPAHATTSLRLTITAVSTSTGAIGLAELEAWTT